MEQGCSRDQRVWGWGEAEGCLEDSTWLAHKKVMCCVPCLHTWLFFLLFSSFSFLLFLSPFFSHLFSPLLSPFFSLSSPSLFLSLPSSPSQGASTSLGTGIPGQQQQQQQNILQQAIQAQLMLNAVKAPGVFSDERDMAVMKFNLLQAYCGTGKGLASHQGQPQTVDFTAENPFCRFKVREGMHDSVHGQCAYPLLPLLSHFSSPSPFLLYLLPSSLFPLSSPSFIPLPVSLLSLSFVPHLTLFFSDLLHLCQTVCYSRLPTTRNEDGLVALQFNKPDTVLLSLQDSIVKTLQDLVGNPNIQVVVDSIRPLPDNW